MRKALIGLLITATAMTPLASAAAQSRGGRDGPRVERAERQLQRAERQERRADRAERRTDRRADRAQRSGTPVRAVRAQRQERRADRVEQRTDRRVVRAERRVERAEDRQRQQRNWDGNRNRNWDDRYRNRGNDNRWDNDRNDRRWDNDRNDRRWDNDRRRDRNWDRGWRNDRRYDWRNYRNRNRHLYRPGRYYSPYRNHHYSRFHIGFSLQPLFYSQRYWIHDPWSYRLPPAYAGTRWVRYYDDVLLVDMYSGEVIDVIYGFFW